MENKDEIKLTKFLKLLDETVFVESTEFPLVDNKEGVEITRKLNPKIEDREATILINGEWDREELKKVLAQLI